MDFRAIREVGSGLAYCRKRQDLTPSRVPADVPLRLVASRAYPFGFVQSSYVVQKG